MKSTETPEQRRERKRENLRRFRERQRAKRIQAWTDLNPWIANLTPIEDLAEGLQSASDIQPRAAEDGALARSRR